MYTIANMLVRSWRVASEQFRDAALSAPVSDMRQRLANRALLLAQQAEALERNNTTKTDATTNPTTRPR